jgi:proteasome accessory factor BC
VSLAVTAAAGGRELSQRLAKIETAIFRRKTIVFDYYTIGRDAVATRKVNPYHLLFRGGQFYLIGYSHERDDVRVFRLSRIRGKVAYVTKAEHDFPPPKDFDHREYATRTEWQLGETTGSALVWISSRIDWLVMRHFGHAGTVTETEGGVTFETEYSDPRALVSWVLGLAEHARIVGPPEVEREAGDRLARVIELHRGELETAPPAKRSRNAAVERDGDSRRSEETAIRPERFARLVTLARILIEAARAGEKLDTRALCESLQISDIELREDIDVLNVVNFGGGSYVVYAEVHGDTIEVDPEPYGDNFAQPARLLPLEAKALVAAIDLVGDHLPEGSLESARKKVVDALGHDPVAEGLQITSAKGDDSDIARVLSRAITQRRLVKIEYYKENEDEFSERTIEPYGLMNGPEGWYVHAYDPSRDAPRDFRLDRIKSADVLKEDFEPREGMEPDVSGWPSTGEVPDARTARVWISPERARWAREDRNVVGELKDGALIVELPYAGTDYLAREILKEAGDAAVLEPADAREAVLEVAERLAGASISR